LVDDLLELERRFFRGQLTGRQSLCDIESCLSTQRHLHYHLGTQAVSKSALGRANEQRDATFYTQLFQVLYQRCTHHTPRHGFRFKHKLFSLYGSLFNASMKLFPWVARTDNKGANFSMYPLKMHNQIALKSHADSYA
jgi:hypothetical protein